jgi:hypothetical protein
VECEREKEVRCEVKTIQDFNVHGFPSYIFA